MSDTSNQESLGGVDFNALVQQAQAMKSQVDDAQQQIADETFTGSAAGDKVTIEVTGAHQYTSIKISPEVVNADDVEMLEDLVLAALRDANTKMTEYQEQTMDSLNMPDIGGMLGG